MSWSRSSPRRLLHLDHCAIAPSRAVDHLAMTRTTTNGATLEQFHELVVEDNVFLLRSNVSTTLTYILRSRHPIFDFFPFWVGAVRRLVVGVLDAPTGLDGLMASAGILSLVGALVVTGMVLVADTGLVWVAVSTITFLVVLIPEGKAQCKHLNLAYRKKFQDQSLDYSQWY